MNAKKTRAGNFLLEFVCFISLAISVLPVVDYYSPWMVTAIPVLFVLFLTIQKKNNVLPVILLLLTFALLGVLQYYFINRDTSFVSFWINFIIAFLPCLIAYQIRYTYENPLFYKRYLQTLAVFTGITSITTIWGLQKYPMASRELASGTAVYDTNHYRAENIGGYEYIYAIVILIPILIYLIKHTEKVWRAINVAILVINIICVYQSQYTTALILVAVVFLLMLAFKNKIAFLISVFSLLLFWILGGLDLLSKIFLFFSENIGQEYVSDRLLQLSQLFAGSEINTETSTARIDHYQNQLLLFVRSPIGGHNLFSYSTENISGHSFVLDWLGSAGLLGFGIVYFLLRNLYKRVVRFSRKKSCRIVKLVWVMLCILAILNPVVFSLITTIAFPACSFLQGYEESLS